MECSHITVRHVYVKSADLCCCLFTICRMFCLCQHQQLMTWKRICNMESWLTLGRFLWFHCCRVHFKVIISIAKDMTIFDTAQNAKKKKKNENEVNKTKNGIAFGTDSNQRRAKCRFNLRSVKYSVQRVKIT